jgi:mycothiol synthase
MDDRRTIPDGFSVRAPTVDDAAEIAEVMNEVTLAEAGIPFTTTEETRDELTSPRDEATPSGAVLIDEVGSLVGYLQLSRWNEGEYSMLVFVRPRLFGEGLNAALVRHGEAQIAERAGASTPVVVRIARFAGVDAAARLFRALGYSYERTFWMMRIELENASIADARSSDGIHIRPFERDVEERAVYEAIAEAFTDHWGSWSETFEQFRHSRIQGAGSRFDPTLWFVASEGDEIVGVACCSASTPRAEDTGEVNILGVRRPWRRRGVGLALLSAAFDEMRRRGIPRCELGVDAENPTGATRLYERAGMHVAYSWEFWKRTLGGTGEGSEP